MSNQLKRIEGLDGLRALACLAVFGVHYQQITGITGRVGPLDVKRLLENGNTGVALFFGLSGFLLSLPFWCGDLSKPNRPWLGQYVRNRAVRILPAYYLCLTALVLFQRHWTNQGELLDTLSHFLFLNSLSEQFLYSISSPFWAISVQVQFYVVLPVLFCVLCRVTNNDVSRVSLVLTLSVCCYLLHFYVMEQGNQIAAMVGISNLVTSRPMVFSHSALAHLPHLLWGVLAAFVYIKLLSTRSTLRRTTICEVTVWLSGLVILAILATPLDEVFQVSHGRYNFPYVPALIAAVMACTPFSYLARRLFEFAAIRHLGKVSYGIYIFHLPCMKLIERMSPQFGFAKEDLLLYAATSLALSIAVASVSYEVIERPLLRYFHRR